MSLIRTRALALATKRRGIAPTKTVVQPAGCRIEDAAGLICDPATGKYAHKTPSRDELERALAFFGRVVGNDTLWTEIDESHYIKALRLRVDELVAKNCRAVRAAEITISKIATTVGWLREMRHIPRDAAPWPKRYKELIKKHWMGVVGTVREPEPHRPRHTLEELHKIMAASTFDPRLELMLWLGIELRLGQVSRALWSDLSLPDVDWSIDPARDERGNDLTNYGTFTVHGSGKKGGVTVYITRGQRQRVDDCLGHGYLAQVEQRRAAGAIADYCLFPAGYIVGRVGFTRGQSIARTLSEKVDYQKHVTSSWIRKNWREAEDRAGVPHVEGRGAYGGRRRARDVFGESDVSQAAIENGGGWVPGSNIPNAVYRNRQNVAGAIEARPVRALIRGESLEKTYSPAVPLKAETVARVANDVPDPRLNTEHITFADTMQHLAHDAKKPRAEDAA